MVVGGNQSGKGAKGLLMGKGAAVVEDDKNDKKKPTSRSSRAGLQASRELPHLRASGASGEEAMVRSKSIRAEEETAAKIRQYEDFVDKRLKPDLVAAIAQRDTVLDNQKTFGDLAKNIQMLQQQKLRKLRTMINLGSEVYAQGEVPDATHIFVDIGLGFHAEFTWEEALRFIAAKEKLLNKQVDQQTQQIASIKGQIKLVGEGIRELMNLSSSDL